MTNNVLLNEGLTIRRCFLHVSPFAENTFIPHLLYVIRRDQVEHGNSRIWHLQQRRTSNVRLDEARARPIRHDLTGNFEITGIDNR